MTQTHSIDHEEKAGRGRYFLALDETHAAELTYLRSADDTIVIDHTFVPRPFEGRGIALELVKRAVADARAGGYKIVPQCPYVAVQFRRHPDWDDLLT